MSQRSRYFKLGAFVIAALLVFVILVVLIGSGRIGRQRVTIETYFDESVQGLDVGSKVKYRGVTVGDVTRIVFTWSRYELDQPIGRRKQYVLVEADVEANLLGGRFVAKDDRQKLIDQQIEKGLRVRLASQGLTGTMYLEVDFVDGKAAAWPLALSWTPENVYVPSSPSTQAQIMDAIGEVLARFRQLDLEATLDALKTSLQTATRQLQALPLDRIGSQTLALVDEIRRTNTMVARAIERFPAERIGGDIGDLVAELRGSNEALRTLLADPALARIPGELQSTIARAREVIDNPALTQLPGEAQATVRALRESLGNTDLQQGLGSLQRALARLERILAGREGDIVTTLENLRIVTDDLRDASELARRYPSQILFGDPPPPAVLPR